VNKFFALVTCIYVLGSNGTSIVGIRGSCFRSCLESNTRCPAKSGRQVSGSRHPGSKFNPDLIAWKISSSEKHLRLKLKQTAGNFLLLPMASLRVFTIYPGLSKYSLFELLKLLKNECYNFFLNPLMGCTGKLHGKQFIIKFNSRLTIWNRIKVSFSWASQFSTERTPRAGFLNLGC